jgi:hypothetical protein
MATADGKAGFNLDQTTGVEIGRASIPSRHPWWDTRGADRSDAEARQDDRDGSASRPSRRTPRLIFPEGA